MKKIIAFILLAVMCVSLTSCSANNSGKDIEPQASQMKSICELATMKCYFHNVAKYTQDDASGALWWKKDRKFWIEYAGIVTVGIDTSLVTMEIEDDTVTISIPSAEVFGCKVDENTLNEDSFIIAQDSAPVEAENQTEAFKAAQEAMKKAAESDTTLLANAQQRAQKLLEDYVTNIGDSIGKTYTIKWNYIENNTSAEQSDSDEQSETDSSAASE